ncbi:ABC transporter permease [Oscillibacter sp.]|uniref:ABC transporter permease n=2 Tax=unclassified Oscillibacter TaxID=2629304 RepID=UPI00289EB8B7|nr:ABC transporter permease [Oscillibacter sp.]
MNAVNRSARLRMYLLLAATVALCVFCMVSRSMMPNDPDFADLAHAKLSPCAEYPFGTDWLGRCVYSRILAGAPLSVFSALAIVALTVVLGCAVGMICGYFGGAVDAVLMRFVDVFMAFPGMILALAVAGMLGAGLQNVVIALAATGWPQYARLSRSYVISLRQENFVLAARLNGQTSAGILFRHILPNAMRPVIVTASLNVGGTILALSGLSFLGLGSSSVDWGSAISDSRGLMGQAPWLVLYPGAAICLTSILFNLLGDSVRDVLDPLQNSNSYYGEKYEKRKGIFACIAAGSRISERLRRCARSLKHADRRR